jgi:sirohydrochlorin cobaltochelatase
MTRPVLLAVAHGTAQRRGILQLRALIEQVRSLDPGLRVELAYVDHEPPSVSAALTALAREGADTVVVPLLIGAASHSKGDLAASVRLARARFPGFRVRYGRPLGPHPLLLEVLAERIDAAGGSGDTPVLLVSAGSLDPDANAEIYRTARLLWEYRGGLAPVEVAFASATGPTVAEGLSRLVRLGHEEVLVMPYFLVSGRLPDAVASEAGAGVSEAGASEARVSVAEVLGAHPGVARVVLARYAEVLDGELAMNCDTCVYRAPWPGSEHRVGEQQRPHAHPADR